MIRVKTGEMCDPTKTQSGSVVDNTIVALLTLKNFQTYKDYLT